MLDAAKANQVTISVDTWQPVGDKVRIESVTDNFYGRGTLTVKNNTNQALTLYMPVGTLFAPAQQGEQTMAGYVTNVQTTAPTPTATPTPTPQPQLPVTAEGPGAPNQGVYILLMLLTVGVIVLGWLTARQAIRYYANDDR